MLNDDKSRIWNSVELLEHYTNFGGVKHSHRSLISNLQEAFGDDLLSSPGITNVIVFCSCASETPRLVNNEEEDIEAVMLVNEYAKM